MTWNYRILKHDKGKKAYYQIHEVYYDNRRRIEAITEDPVRPFGQSKKELIATLRMMLKDAERMPVLSYEKVIKQLDTKRKKHEALTL